MEKGIKSMTVDKIAKNIGRIRNARGFTQAQIADALGVSRATYINMENGKRDLTAGELEELAVFYNITIPELFDSPRNSEKFEQMYFYTLKFFKNGVPKTKLAKLLYLADFRNFFEELEPMSGVRYLRKQYGPLADIFLELTDELYDDGKIKIERLGDAFMIKSVTFDPEFGLLNNDEKRRIEEICKVWEKQPTREIVNYTHEQKPWSSCRDGEYIPYELIIQEDPKHVYAPVA
jgi:transcriptional regulator with XRE-family HTH domain